MLVSLFNYLYNNHKILKNLMYFYSAPYFYQPHPLFPIFSPFLAQIKDQEQQIAQALAQNENLLSKKQNHERQLSSARREHEQLVIENNRLKRAPVTNEKKKKRPYKKRRINLAQNFKCQIKDCPSRFSSDMAYRNHMRLKHGLRKRYNRKRE